MTTRTQHVAPPSIGEPVLLPQWSNRQDALMVRLYKLVALLLCLAPFATIGSYILVQSAGLTHFPWMNPEIIYSLAVLATTAVITCLLIVNIMKYCAAQRAAERFPRSHIIENVRANTLQPEDTILQDQAQQPLQKELLSNVIVCNDPWEAFQLKLAMIKGAQKSIEWSFNFCGGEVFRDVLTALKQRMAEVGELKVHLIMSDDFLEKEDIQLLEELKLLHPEHFFYLITDRQFNTEDRLHTEENHIKLLIVDGLYYALGGNSVVHWAVLDPEKPTFKRNTFKLQMMPSKNLDTDVIGCGSLEPANNIVSNMRLQFFNLYAVMAWRMQRELSGEEGKLFTIESPSRMPVIDRHSKIIPNVKTKFLVSSPEHDISPIEEEYARLIETAQVIVEIATFVLLPTDKIEKALVASKARKIAYVDGLRKNFLQDLKNNSMKGACKYFDKVYETVPLDLCYHKKVMVVDTRYGVVGSTNLGLNSLRHHYECICVFDNEHVCRELTAGLKEDLTQMKERSITHWDTVLGASVGSVLSVIA